MIDLNKKYIMLDKSQMELILVKFLKESLDFLSDDPRTKEMKRIDWIRGWIKENLEVKE